MKAALYEIEYSVSPGGKDQWALEVRVGLGHTFYAEFDTPAQALQHLLDTYGDTEINLDIQTLKSVENMEFYDYAF